ncbi:MAG: hypothetical protein JNM52_06640 [Betaproteobacteria bacterium]|nr:hypothetical protein [Betaproteobacteria bacterium]
MKAIFQTIFAILLGLVLGSVANMALVLVSGRVIPPPPGVDMTTAEGVRAALPLLEPRHFLFPFLAHALGTFLGAFIAAKVTPQRKLLAALVVTVFFLAGGVMAANMIPAPSWFIALDLLGAYLPFGWLGFWLVRRSIK